MIRGGFEFSMHGVCALLASELWCGIARALTAAYQGRISLTR